MVQICQLWSEKEPGLTKAVRSTRVYFLKMNRRVNNHTECFTWKGSSPAQILLGSPQNRLSKPDAPFVLRVDTPTHKKMACECFVDSDVSEMTWFAAKNRWSIFSGTLEPRQSAGSGGSSRQCAMARSLMFESIFVNSSIISSFLLISCPSLDEFSKQFNTHHVNFEIP